MKATLITATSERRSTPLRRPRQVILVSSPKAGTGLGRDQIARLLSLLSSQSTPTHQTDSIRQLRALLEHPDFALDERREPSLDVPVVIAAGGDGTLALVAENVPPHIPIIPMPLGTENLLARNFELTSSADKIVEVIVAGRDIHIDAGRANGKLFLVVASAGFDAEVVRGMHLTRRGHIHRLDYFRPLVRAARRYVFPEIETRIDGISLPGIPLRWAMIFNLPRYAANLAIEPDAVGDDGFLDLVGFTGGSIFSGLRYTGGVLGGWHRDWSDVVRRRACQIELASKFRVPYQLDGDYVGRLPLSIETLPGRVCLRIPA